MPKVVTGRTGPEQLEVQGGYGLDDMKVMDTIRSIIQMELSTIQAQSQQQKYCIIFHLT